MPRDRAQNVLRVLAALSLAAMAAGCPDMANQPRGEPLEASAFFDDGAMSRPLVEGVVPRGHLREDQTFYTGRADGQLLATNPLPVDATLLARGQERFHIHCAPCHSPIGDGQGMIVLRGLTAPPTFHDERLRSVPDGHLYDVITHGFGRMFPYASRIEPHDRWAIVAYIRALQLSRNVAVDTLPAEVRQQLDRSPREAPGESSTPLPSVVPPAEPAP